MYNLLKLQLKEAAEIYERHAEEELKLAERYPGGKHHDEIMTAYNYDRGRAAAMREALKIINEMPDTADD